jgi:hypothetical protein
MSNSFLLKYINNKIALYTQHYCDAFRRSSIAFAKKLNCQLAYLLETSVRRLIVSTEDFFSKCLTYEFYMFFSVVFNIILYVFENSLMHVFSRIALKTILFPIQINCYLCNHRVIELFHIQKNIWLYIGNFLVYLYILYLPNIFVCFLNTHSHLL